MASETKLNLLKVTLIIFALIAFVYGFIYLFFPQVDVKASGGDPVPSGWLRWFGGILLALGVGAIMIIRNPKKQGIFVTTIALGTLLCGLALLYSGLFEAEGIGNVWHTLIPGIINVLLSILIWISIKQSKEILW